MVKQQQANNKISTLEDGDKHVRTKTEQCSSNNNNNYNNNKIAV
jgi:hypothetical protein